MWRWRCRSDRPPQPQRRGGSRLLACATGSTAVLLEAPYYYLQGSSASIAHSLRDTTRANPSANATDRYINTRATRAVPPIHNRSVCTSRGAWVMAMAVPGRCSVAFAVAFCHTVSARPRARAAAQTPEPRGATAPHGRPRPAGAGGWRPGYTPPLPRRGALGTLSFPRTERNLQSALIRITYLMY